MNAMILAAGRGERLRPLTDTTPKPMIKIKGKPLIAYHIENLAKNGIKNIVINLAWLGDEIIKYCKDGSDFGVHIKYSHESAGGLETGGGIKKALALLGSNPFLVVNGDTFLGSIPQKTELCNNNLAHLWLVPNPKHNLKGDFGMQNNKLTNAKDFTFSGIALYHPDFFKKCNDKKFPLAPLFKSQLEQISCEVYNDLWHDVGTLERLNELEIILG